MNGTESINRRQFLQTGVMGSTALAMTVLPVTARGGVTKPDRDAFHGLKMGMASYSLRKFTLEQAIAMTKEAGVKYISLKEVHLPLKSTPEERREARGKIEAAGLALLSGGVIYIKDDEAEVRNIFEYAKDAGMPTIVCSPEPVALDTVERMAKAYDILVAIHNHGPGDKKYPSPLDVLNLVRSRDSRMGICIDVGHTVRLGEDPAAAIRQCAPRLHDFHMKDETQAAAKGAPTEVGRGVIDIVAVLNALVNMGYSHHVGLEYEAHENAPMPGIVESFAYIRGALAAIN